MARPAWVQSRKAFDLLADLGRGIEENPALAARADGDRFLRARGRANASGTHTATVWTPAVPLGKPAPRRRPQHADAHALPLPQIRRRRALRRPPSRTDHRPSPLAGRRMEGSAS